MKKIKKSKVIVHKSFLSKNLSITLHNWILNLFKSNNLTKWNTGYYMGGYKIHDPENNYWGIDEYGRKLLPLVDVPDLFFEIHDKISKKTNFNSIAQIRKNATSLASIMHQDGYVSMHKDTHLEGHAHIRANVMLNCNQGGYPVINNKLYKLNQGDLIIFSADYLDHCTTAQESKDPRTIISYPFLIPDSFFI